MNAVRITSSFANSPIFKSFLGNPKTAGLSVTNLFIFKEKIKSISTAIPIANWYNSQIYGQFFLNRIFI